MPIALKIALPLLAVGIGLIVTSVAWKQDLGFNRGYSEQDAVEYAEASAHLHDTMHHEAHSHGQSEQHKSADVAAAQERFDAAQAKRDAALNARAWTSELMKWLGLTITIVSAVTIWVKRD